MKLEEFERYLICPSCHSKLKRKGDRYFCISNNHVYNISNGIPVLLNGMEISSFAKDIDNAVEMKREFTENFISKLIKITKKIVGSTLHLPISPKVNKIWDSFRNDLSLEIGSGTIKRRSRQINLDIDIFNNVDVTASAANIPFENNTFKLIRNTAVLEHIKDPVLAVNEIYRVLKPEGYVYTEVPFLQHFHAYPNDFQRYTIEGLKNLFHKYEIIETGICGGPGSAITALIADWFELFSFSKRRIVNDALRLFPLVLLLPIKYFDYILVKNPRSHEVAAGLFILCKKPAEDIYT